MSIEIAKENKIVQSLVIEMDKGDSEYEDFVSLVKQFVEKKAHQKVEGVIDSLDVTTSSYSKDITIRIKTIKEDKLKLLEVKSHAD